VLRAALLTGSVLAATACTDAAPSPVRNEGRGVADRTNEIEKFWFWFQKKAPEFQDKPELEMAAIIHSRLIRIDKYLGVLVGPSAPQTKIIITAHGEKALAPLVREIVAAAPPLASWQIIPFIPAPNEDFVHERPGGVRVDTKDVQWEMLSSASQPDSIGICLYLPKAALVHDESEAVIWSILTGYAGEELAMNIDHAEGKDIAAVSTKARPLAQLPFYIQWMLDQKRDIN
jgi:hypothetical protein